jgi:hypothetical protein
VLSGIADKAFTRGHSSLQHHPRHVRLPLPATLMRAAAAEAVVAAAVVAPLVQAAAGATHTRSEHSAPTGSSSSVTSVPNSRVLVAAGEQQDSSSSSSSNGGTGCSTVTAHNGPPYSPNYSTLPAKDGSNSGTVQVTVGATQGPPSHQPSAALPGGSSSNNDGGTLPLQQRAGLQAGDVIVRGGSDGSWHCIRRPGCKPYALAFGAAFRPLMASGECQFMGGCEAVQKQGACNAPFSWEVDQRAAAVVQYCGEQCKCPGES